MKNKVKHIVLICIGSLLMTGTVAVAQGDALSAAISKTRQIKSSPIVQSRAKSKVVMETATVQNSDTQFKDIRNETRLYVQSLSNKRIAEIIKSLGATRLFLESSNATQSRDRSNYRAHPEHLHTLSGKHYGTGL